MDQDTNWATWAGWLGEQPAPGTIYKDVVDMLAARQIWWSFQQIVGVAPEEAKKSGTFHSWVNANYLRSQGLAVRRQAEVRDDVVSLGRLVDSIAKSPGTLTRERYLAKLHPETPEDGNTFFDSIAGPGAEAIDAAIPKGQLRELREKTARIKTWVNKEVAHYDPRTGEFSAGLTFGDVHQAIDLIYTTMNRYQQLLRGVTIAGSVVMSPWEAVFRVAWIPDDDAYRKVMEAARDKEQERMGRLGE